MEGKYTGIRYVHSLGEVKAVVQYTKTVQIPLKEEKKVETGNKETKYKINFNKIQINFYKTQNFCFLSLYLPGNEWRIRTIHCSI